MAEVVLTACDHEQNGFVAVARWPGLTMTAARAFIAAQDELVNDESEPDAASAPFWFVLDLWEDADNCIETGERCLPTQIAMNLAPEHVRRWLDDRPDPDSAIYRAVPVMFVEEPEHG